MVKEYIKRNLKLLIASILFFISGGILGSVLGFLLKQGWIGTLTGLGLSMLVIGIVVLKIYLKDREYTNLKNLYKKD